MKRRAIFALCLFFVIPVQADSPLSGRRIVLDAGHGTLDFEKDIINTGKIRDGVLEQHINLQIAEILGQILEEEGATVFYTRTKNDYWRQSYSPPEDNRNRAFFANQVKAEALISIHCDWHPSRKYHGVTTFYTKKESRKLGDIIQKKMVKSLKAYNRNLVHDSFTILDHAEVPAVLVETGFLSHRIEGRKLLTKNYQTKVSEALASALREYFGTGN